MMDYSQPVAWVATLIGAVIAIAAVWVVTTKNLIHSALALVVALAGTAALFLVLSAEFVAWVLVLVYIGAVVVLFLFGIMITRAPMGYDIELDNPKKGIAVGSSVALFVLMAWSTIAAFGDVPLTEIGTPTETTLIADGLLGRFVLPFELVSFVLLAALIGGITVARKDASPAEEEVS